MARDGRGHRILIAVGARNERRARDVLLVQLRGPTIGELLVRPWRIPPEPRRKIQRRVGRRVRLTSEGEDLLRLETFTQQTACLDCHVDDLENGLNRMWPRLRPLD